MCLTVSEPRFGWERSNRLRDLDEIEVPVAFMKEMISIAVHLVGTARPPLSPGAREAVDKEHHHMAWAY